MRSGYGHANAGREALSQRAGGRFDTGRQSVLGVSGCQAVPLAEVLDLFKRQDRSR
jgi:hypothetical protein